MPAEVEVEEVAHYPWISIERFGGSPAVLDNSIAINKAISALRAHNPPGGTVFFPNGIYKFATPLAITGISVSPECNITFEGNGSRYYQDFDDPVSSLLYTGTGTTAAITISTNYARNFTFHNIDVSYNSPSFKGPLIYVDAAPAVIFDHCSLGGNGTGIADLSSAAAVVKLPTWRN